MVFFGCTPIASTVVPEWTETRALSPTAIPSTSTPTSTPRPTWTSTLTPPVTLAPLKAEETIRALVQEPLDCMAPCFWGITPGLTTLGEAKNVFIHLGMSTQNITYQGKDFYSTDYDFESGLSITITLTVLFDPRVVENLRVGIHPEKQKAGVPREWSAYSPETLIKRYGAPTRVRFWTDWGPMPFFDMVMYFEAVDLIVEYSGYIVAGGIGFPHFCPLTDQFDFIRVWMGSDPQYLPFEGTSLEQATSMTMEEFTELMTGTPSKTCFDLNEEVLR